MKSCATLNGPLQRRSVKARNAVNYSSNDKKKEDKSDVNIMFESEAHTERGSPSLVGRGIAKTTSVAASSNTTFLFNADISSIVVLLL